MVARCFDGIVALDTLRLMKRSDFETMFAMSVFLQHLQSAVSMAVCAVDVKKRLCIQLSMIKIISRGDFPPCNCETA
jgi:small basic protein